MRNHMLFLETLTFAIFPFLQFPNLKAYHLTETKYKMLKQTLQTVLKAILSSTVGQH